MLTNVQVLPGATSVARFGDVVVWFEPGPQGGGVMLTQLLQAAQAVSAGAVPARQMGARLAAVLNTGDATAVPALVAATPDEGGLRVVVHGWGAVVADGVHILNGWVDQVIADRRTFFVGRNTVTPVAPVEGSALDLEDGVVLGDGVSFVLEPSHARTEATSPAPPPALMSVPAATPIEDPDPDPDPDPAAAEAPDPTPAPGLAAAPDSPPGPAPTTPPTPLTTIWGLPAPAPAPASASTPEDPGPEPSQRDPEATPAAADTHAGPFPTASPAPGEAAETDTGPGTTGSPAPDEAASSQDDPAPIGSPAPNETASAQADPAPIGSPAPEETASSQAGPASTGWPVPGAAADDQPEPDQTAPAEPSPYGQMQPAAGDQSPSGAAPAGPPAAPLPAGRLVLDDGSSALLERSCVLGTAPHGSPAVKTGTAIPLTVQGIGVAPVHAEVRVEQGRAGVRDLGSAVTYLLAPGSASWAPLTPGQITTLTPGMRIAIGQRTIAYEVA